LNGPLSHSSPRVIGAAGNVVGDYYWGSWNSELQQQQPFTIFLSSLTWHNWQSIEQIALLFLDVLPLQHAPTPPPPFQMLQFLFWNQHTHTHTRDPIKRRQKISLLRVSVNNLLRLEK
jgi:hypothetical protein